MLTVKLFEHCLLDQDHVFMHIHVHFATTGIITQTALIKRIAHPSAPWAYCSDTTRDNNLSMGKQSTAVHMIGKGDKVCRPPLPPICPSQEELTAHGMPEMTRPLQNNTPPAHTHTHSSSGAEGEIALPEEPKHSADTCLLWERREEEAASGWTEESNWQAPFLCA